MRFLRAPMSDERTMRAAVLVEPRAMRVEQVPRPDPAPGQVSIRVEGCGVCGSNRPLWEGRPWFRYPTPPGGGGHEAWGTVQVAGSGVVSLRSGQRVAFLGDRGFAELAVAEADQCVVLPEPLDGVHFPGEALGCAFNILRRSAVEPGQTVAVLGVGFLGALLVRLLAEQGARVIAIGRRPWSLERARSDGAAEVIRMEDRAGIVDRVRSLTEGRLCEKVVEVVGEQGPLDLAAELTAERGTLVIAGYHQDGLRSVDMQLWNWRGLDVVNAHERDPRVYRRGIEDAVAAAASGMLDVRRYVTHAVPLERAGDAFRLMEDRPEGFLKAVVIP
jgi:threonine dehydrogenase-like Zn-dependent dehydrogenase